MSTLKLWFCLLALFVFSDPFELCVAIAQDDESVPQVESEATRRLKEKLADPDAAQKDLKDRLRPPFEFYRTQVAPFDILPFVKPNHWVTLTEEMQSNLGDFQGELRTAPVRLLEMPQALIFTREARLLKDQPSRQSFQAILPRQTKQLDIELVRPESIRPDDGTQAPLRPLEPHQMLIVLLAQDPSAFATWNRYQALVPANTELDDASLLDQMRYYRLVTYQKPDEPNLSTHSLTWTTISHILWDEFDPSVLNVGQQQALLDWIHWGGQLIIGGGAGKTLTLVSDDESFLSPYLPAEPSGENTTFSSTDLRAMALEYPAPGWRAGSATLEEMPLEGGETLNQLPLDFQPRFAQRYIGVFPIRPALDRPVYLSGLRTRTADAQVLRAGDENSAVIGVERRVGRGRILMLAFDPKEPAFMTWRGYDTFVRRVLLRRVEDPWEPRNEADRTMLAGPDLNWLRYVSRDLGAEGLDSDPETPRDRSGNFLGDDPLPRAPVAAWLDRTELPNRTRDALVNASGIVVPGSPFVLKVMLGYILLLVPLNWLICRFVLRRRELAWVAVPLIAFGFAGAVERAAAIDMGFDLACDEIDVLELQPGYSRGHLSRFSVLYCTSRERFTISFPGEPTALALPMNAMANVRGGSVRESTWQSAPVPSLIDFQVEPRSLALFRAEQMTDLGGPIVLDPSSGSQLINGTNLELIDAAIIETGKSSESWKWRAIGTIGPGQTVDLETEPQQSEIAPPDWIEMEKLLSMLGDYRWGRPEDQGELRLVAWTRGPQDGMEITPKVDRHRGFTLIVVHLNYGPPPSPAGPAYDRADESRQTTTSGPLHETDHGDTRFITGIASRTGMTNLKETSRP